MKDKNRLLNEDIKSLNFQLIDENGENNGIVSRDAALIKAKSLGLDLMEISKDGDTSIVKIIDYGKYLYKQKKQEQKNKQKSKSPDLKNIRISFKIAENDLEIKKRHAEKFAKLGHPLRVTLMLRGRENNYLDIAFEKIKHFIDLIQDFYRLEGEIKKTGNIFSAMLKVK